MTHLSHGRLVTIKGCSHLIPLERPEQMADLLREFCASLEAEGTHTHEPASASTPGIFSGIPPIPPSYAAFLESDRLSMPTREVLEKRASGPTQSTGVLTPEQEQTLRALLDRVIPQRPEEAIDLAGFIMARLATGTGDGWRYAILPADADSYRQGLDRLAAHNFASQPPAAQDELLNALAREKGSPEARWFEDVRGDAAAVYAGHPVTLARWGYSGFGVGGAFTQNRGYVDVGLNNRESWEPVPVSIQVLP